MKKGLAGDMYAQIVVDRAKMMSVSHVCMLLPSFLYFTSSF